MASTPRGFRAWASATVACCGLLISASAAEATPAPLHLSVVVAYKQVKSTGAYELRELVYVGSRRSGEGSTRCGRPSGGQRRCSGSFTLEQGQIDFAGMISDSSTTTRLTITDGGGRYSRVRGTVLSLFSHGDTRAAETITFH